MSQKLKYLAQLHVGYEKLSQAQHETILTGRVGPGGLKHPQLLLQLVFREALVSVGQDQPEPQAK